MYIFMYAGVYIHVYIYIYTFYICISICIRIYIYIFICLYTHMYLCSYIECNGCVALSRGPTELRRASGCSWPTVTGTAQNPMAPSSCMGFTWALKGFPCRNFGIYVYTISEPGAFKKIERHHLDRI